MSKSVKINARQAAFQVLLRVEEGAFLSPLVQEMMREKGLSPIERPLFSELVNGVLKNRLYLDFFLQKWVNRPFNSLSLKVQTALRLGLYQIHFLDGIPPHAAVMETVELIKKEERKATGLTNAVLRRAAAHEDFSIKSKKGLAGHLSIEYSHPLWMIQRWLKRYGPETTEAFLKINQEQPRVYARLNTLKVTAVELEAELNQKGLLYEKSELNETAYILSGSLSDFNEFFQLGWLNLQDLGTMLIVDIIKPKPDERVLDMCAAPGGKTSHLAALMGNQGEIHALELHPGRFRALKRNLQTLGVENTKTYLQDATKWLAEPYDKILLDAPCSGTGVLGRKPDARWKKSYQQILGLSQLQKELLESGFKNLKPGGHLLYSTCSLEWEENEKNIQWFLENEPKAKLLPFSVPTLQGLEKSSGQFNLLPNLSGGDGFFMALLTKLK